MFFSIFIWKNFSKQKKRIAWEEHQCLEMKNPFSVATSKTIRCIMGTLHYSIIVKSQ